MAALPESVSKAWDDRKGPAVFTTVDENGMPNAIYVGCMSKFDEETILVADNYFDKTQKNIIAGTKGSFLFITKEGKSFQIKGTLEYIKEGELFDDMKEWNPKQHPGHGVVVLRIKEAYSGSEKLL